MILKITLRNHLNALTSFVFLSLIVIFLGFWVDFEPIRVRAFIVFYSINALPGLYLHLQYYNVNKGLKIKIVTDHIIVCKAGEETKYDVEDIDKILFYMCPSVAKGSNWRSFCMENYYFARILTKDRNEFNITCLLAPEMENSFKKLRGVKFERRIRLFCSCSLRS